MKRIQFTIWRMLLMTAIVAVLLAVFSEQTIDYRQSIACAAAIAKLGGTVSWNPEILENLVRDQTIARITDVHRLSISLDRKCGDRSHLGIQVW